MLLEDVQDLVINQDELNSEKVTTIDDVLDFDFNSSENFDIEEAFDYVRHTIKPKETKEFIEQKDADSIIQKLSIEFLSSDYVDDMKRSHDNLLSLLKRYNANSELVKNMDEGSKDRIYSISEYLFNGFQLKLNAMTFNFSLSQDEWKFMYDVLRNKLEYDQNEIFQVKELREKYLDKVSEYYKGLPKNTKEILTMINVNDLIVLYHLISKYKVKGINKFHFAYLGLLTKIGERIKLFNAYNVWIQRLSNDFQTWGGSLTVDNNMLIPTGSGPGPKESSTGKPAI